MMGLLHGVVILCCLAFVWAQDQKYCNLKSCNGVPHTMCRFSSPEPAPTCHQLGRIGLTTEEKKAILDRHNEWRAYVASGNETRGISGPQPAAKNLGRMVWNEELAEIAQRWANQCNYGHDGCHDTVEMIVGQNIARKGRRDSWHDEDLLDRVDYWYNQVKDFDRNMISNFNEASGSDAPLVTGYTQMVWAESTMVGCGASRFKRKNRMFHDLVLVCNYGPAGNRIGLPVYEPIEKTT